MHHIKDPTMNGRTAAMLLIAFSVAGLAACGEKSQDLVPAGSRAYENPGGDGRLRERTLNQGESGRIGY